MSFVIDWSAIFYFIITSCLTATAILLWRVSLTVERLESDHASHQVLDDTRFADVDRRLSELRDEVRAGVRR